MPFRCFSPPGVQRLQSRARLLRFQLSTTGCCARRGECRTDTETRLPVRPLRSELCCVCQSITADKQVSKVVSILGKVWHERDLFPTSTRTFPTPRRLRPLIAPASTQYSRSRQFLPGYIDDTQTACLWMRAFGWPIFSGKSHLNSEAEPVTELKLRWQWPLAKPPPPEPHSRKVLSRPPA